MFKTILDKITGKKILFYCSMFGDYDIIKEVPKQDRFTENWVFTDRDYDLKTWKVIKPELIEEGDPMLNSRFNKLNSRVPDDFDYCVYLDSSFYISRPDFISFMLDQLADKKMVFFKHPWRDCVYDEAEECLKAPKYNHDAVQKQIDRYGVEGMPRHFGLWACGIFAFKNDPETKDFFNTWWNEMKHESYMDQLSLPYLAWKLDFKKNINAIDLDVYHNIYTSYGDHKYHYVDKKN